MKLHFLGGADEIGASCLLVETAGRRILVDGGVRMGGKAGDRLPDLSRATDAGGIDAVLITHAHLDHSGALPLISGAFPKAEVFAVEPTCGLLRILLLDAVKIMEQKRQQEEELPLYPLPAVEGLLARTRPVRFYETVELCGGDVRATFFPAGHVLGAAAVGIESAEDSLLVTGDVSIDPQRTVPSMEIPRFKPDAVVCESTYGGRLHASRKAEEQRLIATVTEAVSLGKRVLIPAFALGRAQEVILILRSLLARGEVADFPIWVDGMVRSVCSIYDQYSPYLSLNLQRKVEKHGELFYGARDCIRPVESAEEREEIASGVPCVVIASSGMLSGGPSSFFARHWCGREDAVLCITGYQDEEAPGRKLQEVQSGEAREINIDGVQIPVRCRVDTYALSAHADSLQLTSMITALKPERVFLVHGDAQARLGLSETMARSGLDVYLPATGESLEFQPSENGRAGTRRSAGEKGNAPASETRGRQKPAHAGIGKDTEFAENNASILREWCWEKGGAHRPWLVAELAEIWCGTGRTPRDLEPFRRILLQCDSMFRPDPRRPFHFRVSDPRADTRPGKENRDSSGKLEQNTAIAFARELLAGDPTFYKIGADRTNRTLMLGFHFPEPARTRHLETMDRIAEHTGWQVEIAPNVHAHALTCLVREALSECCKMHYAISVYNDLSLVEVRAASLPPKEEQDEISHRIERETGFSLRFKKAISAPKPKETFDSTGRMEINLAYGEIDRAFSGMEHRPYKKSKKVHGSEEFIQLSFISPEVGRRYRNVMDTLEERTGWTLKTAEKIDQGAVLALARKLIPDGWALKKTPGLDTANRKVLIKPSAPIAAEEMEKVSAELLQESGFTLHIR